ncbi:MAG TPA: 2-hydroxyacid dehydrogenase [Acidobacteriaceae bacterium]|jgi:phosphoglycerate dehydrogenase-like enzyme|nr:2-hydroxyacid dehydrogenase [Acidobacteriaceae bacterium]
MLRVGLPENIPQAWLSKFPKQVQLVPIATQSSEVQEIEFWIPPLHGKTARLQYERLRGIKVAQSLYAGVDYMLPWISRDITLCDGQGIHDMPVAEWVVGAILSAVKRFPEYRDRQREEFWDGQLPGGKFPEGDEPPPHRILGEELAGQRVMIVGYGGIGAAVEKRLQPFDVEFVRVARSARPGVSAVSELPKLLPQADIVVLIVPLTDETHGMMNAALFDRMKKGALLVNAARGPVVDTEALLGALRAGHIRAVLDVTDPEPLPKGHPLWSAPNCFITPHVAGSTPGFFVRAYDFAGEQAERYLAGKPLKNIVNQHGY